MKQLSKYKQALKTVIRVIIYLRVSTEDQARREDNSIKTQEVFCERLIALNENRGWVKVGVVKDEGYSAKNLNRPGIREIIEAIEAGEVDIVVIYKLDRLTRSMRDLYKLWEVMEKHGVDFASATESFNSSTPDGRAALHQRMTFAQWEREMTSQRLQDKFSEDARNGKWHPGMCPYGYDPDSRNKTLILNPVEAKFVKMMFEMASEGCGLKQIADTLNKLGSRTKLRNTAGRKDAKLEGGKKWTVKTIRTHIENHKYCAITRDSVGNRYPANWEAIITEKLWQQANDRLVERRESNTKPKASTLNRHRLVFKELLQCGHCGRAMSPRCGGKKLPDGSQRSYYSCQHVIDHGSDSSCPVRNLPGEPFDRFMINAIGAFARHPEVIAETLKAALEEKKHSVRPMRSRLKELNTELKQLSSEIKNLTKIARKRTGDFTKELYDDADDLAAQKKEIEQECQQLKARIRYKEQVVADKAAVAKALGNFEKLFYALEYEDRAELLGLLMKSVKIFDFDPASDTIALSHEDLATDKSTQWYRIEVEFFIQSHFEEAIAQRSESNTKIRTRMNSTFIVGLVGKSWANGAVMVHPFHLNYQRLQNAKTTPKFRILKGKHMLVSILEWKETLSSNTDLYSADIAKQVKLSPIRVRHLLQLVKLRPEIISAILSYQPSRAKKTFSLQRLQALAKLDKDAQLDSFRSNWPEISI